MKELVSCVKVRGAVKETSQQTTGWSGGGRGGILLSAFRRKRDISCLQRDRRMKIAEILQYRLNMQLDPQSVFELHVLTG